MSDQLDQQLAQLVLAARAAGKATADFVVEQAPQLAQEIIRWGIYSHVLLALVFGVLLGVLLWQVPVRFRRIEQEEGKFFIALFGAMAIVGCLIVFVTNSLVATKAVVAPRLYLLEYINGVMRGH